MSSVQMSSGIFELMRDLGEGIQKGDSYLLGGGNPAQMDETYSIFSEVLKDIAGDPLAFSRAFQCYSEPKGYLPFRETLVKYFNQELGWNLTPDHICLTNGMQNGFYMLLTHFIQGETPQSMRKIHCAKLPDYIGYFDTIPARNFGGSEARKVWSSDQFFTYQIDFEAIESQLKKEQLSKERITAFVISTPNNPSSHVLLPQEMEGLINLMDQYEKYLIFDHAYGYPFPNIIYERTKMPPQRENIVHCFSFSKIGLPGIRMGVIVAEPRLVDQIALLNGIQNLAPSSFSAVFLNHAFKHRKLNSYLLKTVPDFYFKRKELALKTLLPFLKESPAALHEAQGGFFLWLYLRGLKKSGREVYLALKQRGVVVVPGEYFFLAPPEEPFLRISYTTGEEELIQGLEILGDYIRSLYRSN